MEMLLRQVNIGELASIFAKAEGLSPAPQLLDAGAVARARREAKRNGVWAALDSLDGAQAIPVLKRSDFRRYRRTGDREVVQARTTERRQELNRAALALWLGHPAASVDYLQDLLWAYCEDSTWVMAAHEGRAIDLGSAALGATLAEIVHVLGGRLEEEVTARVGREIERRIFEPYRDYRNTDFWKTVRMNWNHVCNGEVIRAALYRIADPAVLANLTHGPIQNMTYALDGFADDGGCEEGTGYWGYGFGHYVKTAYALWRRTGGALDLMKDETGKIERICRYPLAAHIAGPLRASFADCSQGYIAAEVALMVNAFYPIPELYGLCEPGPAGRIQVGGMHELALYRGERAGKAGGGKDYVLPDLGMASMRGAPGPEQLTALCLAGNNGVPHNHNDIGSFMVYKRGRLALTDPGGPKYTAKTFGPKRYESLFCGSQGHSVPRINGRGQEAGHDYAGTLAVENLNGTGVKRAVVDMTRAYPAGTVKALVRTFELTVETNALAVEDAYVFERMPRSVEEVFVTYEQARVKGGAVRIGPERGGVTLKAEGAGRFRVERLEEESKEGRTGEVVTRIVFTPARLARRMVLRFRVA